MTTLGQDVRHAFRNIRGAPGLFATIVATLAIGIGANTALFSVLRTVLLEPLPYPSSDQLVVVSRSPWQRAEVAMMFRDLPNVFHEVAGYSPMPIAITGGDQPDQVQASSITPNFFHLFGTTVDRGREFTDADARPGAAPTAIIAYELWMTRYGGRADIVGQVIRVNDEPHRIIAVTRREFRLFGPRSGDPQVWLPFELRPRDERGRPLWVIPVARMGNSMSLEGTQAAIDRAWQAFVGARPQIGRDRRSPHLTTIRSEIIKDARTALILLQLGAAALLLITCVNVANLLLARAVARQHDVAIRSALGASHWRLIRQLVTESLVLSMLGALAGLLLMRLTLGFLISIAPADVPRLADVRVDTSAFLIATLLAAGTGIVSGLVPASVALRASLHEHFLKGGRRSSRSDSQRRTAHVLVVAEVTLSLMLLVSAGLVVESFFHLTDQPLGFRTRDVLTMPIQIPPTHDDSVEQLDAFYAAALERLRAIPGVQSVAIANNLPISRGNARREYEIEGAAESRTAQYGVVSASYFEVLGIPLLKGRYFDASDRRGGLKVAIIDQAMAREAFPNQDPIGKRFRFEDGNDAWLTIIGVVGNTRGAGLAGSIDAGFYIPYTQRPALTSEIAVGRIGVFLVQSRGSIAALGTSMRNAIWAVNPHQPITGTTTLADAVAAGAAPQRFRAVLFAAFASAALVLVLVGIYGVIEYAVAERTREIGIRMALGATPSVILADVLLGGLRLAAIGGVLGLAGALALNRFVSDMLFGVTPTDPLTLATALALILVLTTAACVVPARRAMRVNPIVAVTGQSSLRHASR